MGDSSIVDFSKNVLLPVLIAGALYLIIFHALLPLYRQNRARYSQYLPLQSASLSSHLPRSLQPSSLRDQASHFLFRLFLPTTWASRSQSDSHRRASEDSTGEQTLFDDQSGEAMVGFDVHSERSRRRDGMDRQVAQGINAAREMSGYYTNTATPAPRDSEQRLGRELEEGFRDESEDEDEAQESRVTAGRRSFSASR